MKLSLHLTPKRKSALLALMAGMFTGAETVVNAGVELPGSATIPVWLRLVVIVAVTTGAFYFRWRAAKESKNAG